MQSTSSKTVFITGCGHGGIGHALAKEFHSRGFKVFASSRRLETMEDLAPLGITVMELDVCDVRAIRKVRDEISSTTGGTLDVLVNNAGQAYAQPATDMTMERVREVFEVNTFAPISIVQEFVHLLIASGDGRIVQIGSVAGIMPYPFGAAYNASKAALHSFGNTIRIELAPFNVKVLSVITGQVKSNIARPHTIRDDSMYKPMEDLFQERRVRRSQMGAMPTEEYARTVVSEAIKPKPRAWLWAGNNSWLVWFMDTFLGRTALEDNTVSKMFGLSEFSAMIKSGKVKVA